MTSTNTKIKTPRKATKQPVPRNKGGRPPVGKARKYDWEAVRKTFIEGLPSDPAKPDGDRTWVSQKELADRVDVPYQRIRERSSKERWTELRANYQAELARKRQQGRIKRLATEATEFDDSALNVAKIGQKLVATRLAEIARDVSRKNAIREQALRDLEAGRAIDPIDLRSAIYSKELESLAKSSQLFQEIGMRALGTDVQRHEINGQLDHGVTVEHTISVVRELERDDPDRLGAFLAAAHNAGVFQQLAELEADDEEPDDDEPTDAEIQQQQDDDIVYDAEIVE